MSGPTSVPRQTSRAPSRPAPSLARACPVAALRALVRRHARPARAPEALRRRVQAALRAAARPAPGAPSAEEGASSRA